MFIYFTTMFTRELQGTLGFYLFYPEVHKEETTNTKYYFYLPLSPQGRNKGHHGFINT